MATFFSGQQVETWAGYALYATLTGDVTRSGNTLTLSNMRATFTSSNPWGSDSRIWFAIYDGGSELTRTTGLTFSNQVAYQSYNNVSIWVANSDTQHTFIYRSSGGQAIYFTVYFESAGGPPTGLAVNNVWRYSDGFSADVSISSWNGNPGYIEFIVGQDPGLTSVCYVNTNGVLSYNIAVRDSNNWGHKDFTIMPNTSYSLGAYATNYSYSTGRVLLSAGTTSPPKPIVAITNVHKTSVDLSVSTANQGGAFDQMVEYTMDNTTWELAFRFTGSGAKQGNFTIKDLNPNTDYTITFRNRPNTANFPGDIEQYTIKFRTDPKHIGTYSSVADKAEKNKKIYCSVNDKSRKIKKIYASARGKARRVL